MIQKNLESEINYYENHKLKEDERREKSRFMNIDSKDIIAGASIFLGGALGVAIAWGTLDYIINSEASILQKSLILGGEQLAALFGLGYILSKYIKDNY